MLVKVQERERQTETENANTGSGVDVVSCLVWGFEETANLIDHADIPSGPKDCLCCELMRIVNKKGCESKPHHNAVYQK